MYEGAPNHPREDRFWSIIEKYRVSLFYTAPTAIRAFIKWGDQWPAKHDLSSLRLLGTVGEPINPEAWMWYHEHIGQETLPHRRYVVADGDRHDPDRAAAGSDRHQAGFGDPAAAGRRGRHRGQARPIRCRANQGGLLVIRQPWPAMLRTIFGDDERYRQQYW